MAMIPWADQADTVGSIGLFVAAMFWSVYFGFPYPDATYEETIRYQFNARVSSIVMLFSFISLIVSSTVLINSWLRGRGCSIAGQGEESQLPRIGIGKVAMLLVALVCTFAAGLYLGDTATMYAPPIEVSIRDSTGNEMEVVLAVSSSNLSSHYEVKNQKRGETRIIRSIIAGEGVVSINAQLPSGKVVEGAESYVESGYRMHATISDTDISATVSLGH